MRNSKISWTDHTFNPWIGCQHVSAECDNCYADALVTNRMQQNFAQVRRAATTWKQVPRWNKEAPALQEKIGRRVRVFMASLTDFFIKDADAWRGEAWELVGQCKNLDFLILTKRPALINARLPKGWGEGWQNVWLGTTCGVKKSYPRLDVLRKIPARVRFISAEPLLESLADIDLKGYHWLIAGGESGTGFRPMKDAWATELRDKCLAEGVGFHFKQHSAFRSGTGENLAGKLWHQSPSNLVQIAGSKNGDI